MTLLIEPDVPVSEAVIQAVSEFESRPPTALPSLYDSVDIDAVDSLCVRQADGTPKYACRLTFPYSDSYVVVDTCGWLGISITSSKRPIE